MSTKDRLGNPDTRKGEPLTRHDPPLLYDLSQDIGEQRDISLNQPEIAARLLKELEEFRGN